MRPMIPGIFSERDKNKVRGAQLNVLWRPSSSSLSTLVDAPNFFHVAVTRTVVDAVDMPAFHCGAEHEIK
jgi:hypothetical protein